MHLRHTAYLLILCLSVVIVACGKRSKDGRQYAYFLQEKTGSIVILDIHPKTGTLTPKGIVAVGKGASSVALAPGGRLAFVTNATTDTLWIFTIDPTTGRLLPAAPSAVRTGPEPILALAHPSKPYVYTLNRKSSGVSIFSYSPDSGATQELAGSPMALAGVRELHQIALDSSGQLAYATGVWENAVTYASGAFAIDQHSGRWERAPAAPFSTMNYVRMIGIDRSGVRAYLGTVKNGVETARIDRLNGALEPIPNSRCASVGGIERIAFEPRGKFVLAGTHSGILLSCAMQLEGGTVSLVADRTTINNQPVTSIAVSDSGEFVYVTNTESSQIFGFRMTDTGQLAPIPGSPFEASPEHPLRPQPVDLESPHRPIEVGSAIATTQTYR